MSLSMYLRVYVCIISYSRAYVLCMCSLLCMYGVNMYDYHIVVAITVIGCD